MSTEKSFELLDSLPKSPGRYEVMTGTIVDPKIGKVIRNTTLQGPYEWLTKKTAGAKFINPVNGQPWYSINLCHVSYSFESKCINLYIHEHDEQGSVQISGMMVPNPVLAALKINEGALMIPKIMASQLKMQRRLFADLNEHLNLISNLEKFRIKVEQELVSDADKSGQKRVLFEQKVKHEIPLSFTLDTQIFLGYPGHKFKVEVCFDVRDRAVEMWLESVELYELMNSITRTAIESEINKLESDFPDLAILEY